MSKKEHLPKIRFFTNGSTVKHLPNRNLTVITDMEDKSVYIEARSADMPKEDLEEKSCHHAVLRGIVKETGIKLSFEAAKALHYQLEYLLGRVLNEEES